MNSIMNQQALKVFNQGSKVYSLASFILPEEVMLGSSYLYHWFHFCDEAINHGLFNETVDSLRNKVFMMTSQSPLPPPFESLKLVMKKHSIPLHYPLEFLEGLRMNRRETRLNDLFELDLYCYRVSATKALMVSHVMGSTDEKTLEGIKHLGMAIELINITKKLNTHFDETRNLIPLNMNRLELSDISQSFIQRANSYFTSGLESISLLPFRSGLLIYITAMLHQNMGDRITNKKSIKHSALRKCALIIKSIIFYILFYLPQKIKSTKPEGLIKTMRFEEK